MPEMPFSLQRRIDRWKNASFVHKGDESRVPAPRPALASWVGAVPDAPVRIRFRSLTLVLLTSALAPAAFCAQSAPGATPAQVTPFEGHNMPVTSEPQLPATPPTGEDSAGQTASAPVSQAAGVPVGPAGTASTSRIASGTGPGPGSTPAPLSATPVLSHTPANRAEVSYNNGLINVHANNSSLRQILRAISRRTGMTIVGGITDDRVFGNYGPDTPSAVLATLVYGTGTNMLLREGDSTHPMELVLTPRTGGVSPGSNFAGPDTDEDDPPAVDAPTPARTPDANAPSPGSAVAPRTSQNPLPPMQPGVAPINVNGSPSNTTPTASEFPTTNSVPVDSLPAPSTTPSSSGIVDSPNPPSAGAGSTAPPAPTPEQVYQQLLRLQGGQQNQPANSNSGSSNNPPQ